ncbi:hypothetical protein ADM90_08015 [Lysinibacillus macroides]|uniref:Uncharacterized protein n=1 Tax=Lysinibacillus macroides TaxID=33935 RepID=A0A0N0CWR1_9BACI|nr:hypothetical protein ADM90_08015 [Lysinibacillus macroides]
MMDAFLFESVINVNIIENGNVIIHSTDTNSIDESVSGGFDNEEIHHKKVIFKIRILAITKDIV